MTIGASIFLAAIGAILRYAVDDRIAGVDLATVGLILIIAGAVGLIAGLALLYRPRDREVVRDDVPRDRDVIR